jgi:hypothetical protein
MLSEFRFLVLDDFRISDLDELILSSFNLTHLDFDEGVYFLTLL